ncbi:MAG: right-handed parallel beta-helix repeat-containing protein [Armatimonadetes bacterium]|nr:right-handed parallel beta-helix repeat-containing protein [Armatimonadota bacterium]
MRHLLWVILLSAAISAAPVELFVAPGGNDAAAGTKAAPLATVQRARDAIRELKAGGRLTDGAVITLAGGVYYLPATLTFQPEDSGRAGAPIVYRGAPGANVILSGGQPVANWRVAGNRWQAKLPDGSNFTQLFINGERRFRPRWPRQGYAYATGNIAPTPDVAERGANRLRFEKGALRADQANLDDVEVLCFHTWSVSRMRLAKVDDAARIATFRRPTWHPSMAGLGAGTRYLVENVKEQLGQPGDWYLDRPTATLTYVPMPGEAPERALVIAPRLTTLVQFQGDIAGRRWVEHLEFRGLTFAHANWLLEPDGHSLPQAESGMAAAVTAEGLRDSVFEDCRLTRLGGYALELGNGTKRVRVERCELTDLGGGGIKIGPGAPPDDEGVAGHNTVRDCLIAHGGRMHPPAVGIWLGFAHHCELSHNEIADFYYSGISAGWTWGYGDTPTRANTIADNHIHDMPQRVLGDEAGIYTLGVATGTVISGNVVHDQVGVPWGVGIYLDEGSSGITVENNLVYRCTTHSFNVNYGRENTARNNIFGPILDDGAPLLRCGRMEQHLSMALHRNILLYDVGHLVDNAWPRANCELDSNLYWNRRGNAPRWGDLDLAAWQAKGQDVDSVVADPMFVDPEHGDYRLKPGSPAAKVGFKPWDYSKAGRLTNHTFTKSWPAVYAPAIPPPPAAVADDFEDGQPGAKPSFGTALEDSEAASLRLTAETAASGKQSLKFTDAAGQPNFYNPHLLYNPGYDHGTARVSFDLRLEPGAPFEHAWRDGGQPWKTGPALAFGADGWLTVQGTKLLEIPRSVWVHYQLDCALGDKADGTYTLTVALPGQPPKVFAKLHCDDGFRKIAWCGFVSVANGPAVIYLDNLNIEPR